jgi:hypothetical protein
MYRNNYSRYGRSKFDERGRIIFYNDPVRVIMTCKNCKQEVDSYLLNYSIKDGDEKQKKLGCKKCGGEN